MHDLQAKSFLELATDVRTGRTSSVDLVEAHIRRIEQVNPTINALVADRFAEARAEAAAADAHSGPKPPFHGVPVTIKEYIAVTGMPQTGGLVSRAGHRSTRDAPVVARLRGAGAIVLGVSNAPEGGLWLETYNRLYGRTNHPTDPARTSGGSSGGEAALVASGGSPLGLGSDTAGSIRLPCLFCGVAGHKPTGGLVPNTGQFPAPSSEGMSRAMVVGPIARSVHDLAPVLRVIAGPDGVDPACEPMEIGDPGSVAIEGLRVASILRHRGITIAPSMIGAVHRAAAILGRRGARPSTLDVPELATSFLMWTEMLTAISTEDYADIVGNGRRLQVRRELVPWMLRRSAHTAPVLLVSALENLFRTLPARDPVFARKGQLLRERLLEHLGPDGVILHPTYSRPAPRHRTPLLRPLDFLCTALYSLFGFPVTQVPLGVDDRGLPVGVQVVGAPGCDHVTLAAAAAIEDTLRGRRAG